MPELPNTVGVFLVLEVFAAPFGYEGASAIMNRQWARAIAAYLIAVPLAAGGLLALGVPILGQSWTASLRPLLIHWLTPLSNPYLIFLLLLFVLFWIARGRRAEKQTQAAEAPAERVLRPTESVEMRVNYGPDDTRNVPFVRFYD